MIDLPPTRTYASWPRNLTRLTSGCHAQLGLSHDGLRIFSQWAIRFRHIKSVGCVVQPNVESGKLIRITGGKSMPTISPSNSKELMMTDQRLLRVAWRDGWELSGSVFIGAEKVESIL